MVNTGDDTGLTLTYDLLYLISCYYYNISIAPYLQTFFTVGGADI